MLHRSGFFGWILLGYIVNKRSIMYIYKYIWLNFIWFQYEWRKSVPFWGSMFELKNLRFAWTWSKSAQIYCKGTCPGNTRSFLARPLGTAVFFEDQRVYPEILKEWSLVNKNCTGNKPGYFMMRNTTLELNKKAMRYPKITWKISNPTHLSSSSES